MGKVAYIYHDGVELSLATRADLKQLFFRGKISIIPSLAKPAGGEEVWYNCYEGDDREGQSVFREPVSLEEVFRIAHV